MPNLLAAIKAAAQAAYPGATIEGRGERHLLHRIGNRRILDAIVGDLHYHDGAAWQEINTDWIDSDDGAFTDRVSAARFRVYSDGSGKRRIYPRRGVTTEYVELARPQYWTGSQWQNLNVGARTRSGDSLTWDRPNFGIKVSHTGSQVKLAVTLKNSSAATRIRWPISLVGLTRSAWSLIADSDGAVVVRIPQPWLVDANGIERTVQAAVQGGAVEITADVSGLVYPVVIDPTLDLNIGASTDDAYSMADGTSYEDNTTTIQLGKATQSYDSGWRWTGVNIPAGATIDVSYVTFYFATSNANNNYNIFGDDENNPATFASGSMPTNRAKTAASVSWSTSDFSGLNNTPSLNAVIQEIVDDGSGSGDALAILIENGTGANYTRSGVRTYDYGSSFPALHVEYTAGGTAHSGAAVAAGAGTGTAAGKAGFAGKGAAAGASTAAAVGTRGRLGAAVAQGASSGVAVGTKGLQAVSVANGASTAAAVGLRGLEADAAAAGTSATTASGQAGYQAQAAAAGTSTAVAAGTTGEGGADHLGEAVAAAASTAVVAGLKGLEAAARADGASVTATAAIKGLQAATQADGASATTARSSIGWSARAAAAGASVTTAVAVKGLRGTSLAAGASVANAIGLKGLLGAAFVDGASISTAVGLKGLEGATVGAGSSAATAAAILGAAGQALASGASLALVAASLGLAGQAVAAGASGATAAATHMTSAYQSGSEMAPAALMTARLNEMATSSRMTARR